MSEYDPYFPTKINWDSDFFNDTPELKTNPIQDKQTQVAKAANTKKAAFTGKDLLMSLEEFREAYPNASLQDESAFLLEQEKRNDTWVGDWVDSAVIGVADNLPMLGNTAMGMLTGDSSYFDAARQQQLEAEEKRKYFTPSMQESIQNVEALKEARDKRLDAEGVDGAERFLWDLAGGTVDLLRNPLAFSSKAMESAPDLAIMYATGGLSGSAYAAAVSKGKSALLLEAAEEVARKNLEEMTKEAGKDQVKIQAMRSLGSEGAGGAKEQLSRENFKAALLKGTDEAMLDVARTNALKINAAKIGGAKAAGDAYVAFSEGSSAALQTYQGIMDEYSNNLDKFKSTDEYLSYRLDNPKLTDLEILQKVALDKSKEAFAYMAPLAVAAGRVSNATETFSTKLIDKTTDTNVGGKILPEFRGKAAPPEAPKAPVGKAGTGTSTPQERLAAKKEAQKKAEDKEKADKETPKPSMLQNYRNSQIRKDIGAEYAEEFVQSGMSQVISNAVVQTVNEDQDLVEGVGYNAGQGGLTGALSAGTTSGTPEVVKNSAKAVGKGLDKAVDVTDGIVNNLKIKAYNRIQTKNTSEAFNHAVSNPIKRNTQEERKNDVENIAANTKFSSDKKYGYLQGYVANLNQQVKDKSITEDEYNELIDLATPKIEQFKTELVNQQKSAADAIKNGTLLKNPAENKAAIKFRRAGSKEGTENETPEFTDADEEYTFDQAFLYATSSEGVKDKDLINRLAGSKIKGKEAQKKLLKGILSKNALADVFKNRSGVARDILKGSDTHRGLEEYVEAINLAVMDKNEDALARLLLDLKAFQTSHATKLKNKQFYSYRRKELIKIDKDEALLELIQDELVGITHIHDYLTDVVKQSFPDLNVNIAKTSDQAKILTGDYIPSSTVEDTDTPYTVPNKTRRNVVKSAISRLLTSGVKAGNDENEYQENLIKLANLGFTRSRIKELESAQNELDRISEEEKKVSKRNAKAKKNARIANKPFTKKDEETLSEDDQKIRKEMEAVLDNAYQDLIEHYGSVDKLKESIVNNSEDDAKDDIDSEFDGYQPDIPNWEDEEKIVHGHKQVRVLKDNEEMTLDLLNEHNERANAVLEHRNEHPESFTSEESRWIDENVQGNLSIQEDNLKEHYNNLAEFMNKNQQVPWAKVPQDSVSGKRKGNTPNNRVFLNFIESLSRKTSKFRKSLKSLPRKIGLVHTEENLMEILATMGKDKVAHPRLYTLIRHMSHDQLTALKAFNEFYDTFSKRLDSTAMNTQTFEKIKAEMKKRQDEINKKARKEHIAKNGNDATFIPTKSVFSEKNYVLDELFDSEGKIRPQIKLGMALAAMDVLGGELVHRMKNMPEVIAAMLDKPDDYRPTKKEESALASGMWENFAVESAGERFIRTLGLVETDEASADYLALVRGNVGSLIIASLTDSSSNRKPLLVKRYVARDKKTGEITRYSELDGESLAPKENENVVALVIPAKSAKKPESKLERHKFHSDTENAMTVISNHEFTEDFLGIETNHVPLYFGRPAPNQDDVDWLSEKQKEAVRAACGEPHEIHTQVTDTLEALYTHSEEGKELALNTIDTIPSDENTHKNRKRINEARRDKRARVWENIFEMLRLSIANGMAPIFIRTTANRSNKRMQQHSSLGSPQSEKGVRAILKMSRMKLTLKPQSKDEKDKLAMLAYKFAISEALDIKCVGNGMSVDKAKDADITKSFTQKVLNNKQIMEAANAIKAMNIRGNKQFTDAEFQAIKAVLGNDGRTAHKLEGLVALAEYDPNKPFEVFTFKENDAVTSGIAISLAQLANAKSWDEYISGLSRVGIYAGRMNYVGSYQEWANEVDQLNNLTNKDTYKYFASLVENYLTDPVLYSGGLPTIEFEMNSANLERWLGKGYTQKLQVMQKKKTSKLDKDGKPLNRAEIIPGKRNKDGTWTKKRVVIHIDEPTLKDMAKASQGIMEIAFLKDGKVTNIKEEVLEVARNFMKDPVMISNYGAGIRGLKKAMVASIQESMELALEQAHIADDTTRAAMIESMKQHVMLMSYLPLAKLSQKRQDFYSAKWDAYNKIKAEWRNEKDEDKKKKLAEKMKKAKNATNLTEEDKNFLNNASFTDAWPIDESDLLNVKTEELFHPAQMAIEFTFGPALEYAFEQANVDYKAPINKIIHGFRLTALAYKFRYQKEYAARKRANKGEFTVEMRKQLEADLKQYEPKLMTALSDDRLKDGLSSMSYERTPNRSESSKYVIPIQGDQKDSASSAKGTIWDIEMDDPGVGMYAKIIHMLDATQIVNALVRSHFEGVHDAQMNALNENFENTKILNEEYTNMWKDYSIMDSLVEMMGAQFDDGTLTQDEIDTIISQVNNKGKVMETVFGTNNIKEIMEDLRDEADVRNQLRMIPFRNKAVFNNFAGGKKSAHTLKLSDIKKKDRLTPEEQEEEFNRIMEAWQKRVEARKKAQAEEKLKHKFSLLIQRANGTLSNDPVITAENSTAEQIERDSVKGLNSTKFIGGGARWTNASNYFHMFKSFLSYMSHEFNENDTVFVSVNQKIKPRSYVKKKKKTNTKKQYGSKRAKKTKGTGRKAKTSKEFNKSFSRAGARTSMFTSDGKLHRNFERLPLAIEGKATILTDTIDRIQNDDYIGEKELALYLHQNGYVPTYKEGDLFMRWVPAGEAANRGLNEVKDFVPPSDKVRTFKPELKSVIQTHYNMNDTDSVENHVKQIISRMQGTLNAKGKPKYFFQKIYDRLFKNFPKSGATIVWHEKIPRQLNSHAKVADMLFEAKTNTIHVFGPNIKISDYNDDPAQMEEAITLRLLEEMHHATVLEALVKAGSNSVPAKHAKAIIKLAVEGTPNKSGDVWLASLETALTPEKGIVDTSFHSELLPLVQQVLEAKKTGLTTDQAIARLSSKEVITFTAEMAAKLTTNRNLRSFIQNKENVPFSKKEAESYGLVGAVYDFLKAVFALLWPNSKAKDLNMYTSFMSSMALYDNPDYTGLKDGYTRAALELISADMETILKEARIEDPDDQLRVAHKNIITAIEIIFKEIKILTSKNKDGSSRFKGKTIEERIRLAKEKVRNDVALISRLVDLNQEGLELAGLIQDMSDETGYTSKDLYHNWIAKSLDENGKVIPDSALDKLFDVLEPLDKTGSVRKEHYLKVMELIDPTNTDSVDLSSYYLHHKMNNLAPSKVRINQSNVRDVFDALGAVNASVHADEEHKSHLKEVLNILAPVMNAIDVQFTPNDDEATYGTTSENLAEIFVNTGAKYSQLEISPQEAYVHELLHPFLWAANKKGKVWRAIQAEYDHVRKNLKVEDFLADILHPSEDDIAQAQKNYDHVVHNSVEGFATYTSYLGDSKVMNANPVEEFVVYALSNQAFKKAYANMNKRNEKPQLPTTFSGKILGFLRAISHYLGMEVKNLEHMRRDDRLMKLAGMLYGTQRQKTGLIEFTQDKATSIYDGVDDVVKGMIKRIPIVNSYAKVPELMEKSEDFRTIMIEPTLKEFFFGKSKALADLASEFTLPRLSLEELVVLLTKASRDLEKGSQNLKEFMVKNVAHNLPNLTANEQRSIYYGAVKADISALAESYSLDEIRKFISKESARNKEILKVREQIMSQFGKDANWLMNNAADLGYFIVTGKRLYLGGSHINANQIVNKFGLPQLNRAQAIPNPKKAEKLVDTLASLYALQHTEYPLNKRFVNNDVELSFIIQMQSQLKQLALQNEFNGSEYNFRKGYMSDVYKSQMEVVITTQEEGKKLIAQGWRKEHKVDIDPMAETGEPKYYYIRDIGGQSPLLTGIYSYKGDKTKGQDLFPIHGVKAKTALKNAMAFERMQRARQVAMLDLAKNPRPAVILPEKRHLAASTRYNAQGVIQGFQQETSEKIKDTLMGREYDFGTSMGLTIGGLKRKVETRKINKEAVESMFRIYENEFKRMPKQFIIMDQAGEDFLRLPVETQEQMKKLWGNHPIRVRREQYNVWFGFRRPRIRDLTYTSLDNDKGWGVFRTTLNNLFIEVLQNRLGIIIEENWLNLVKMSKDALVIKSLIVTAGNIVSNIALLWISGVPLAQALEDTTQVYINMYRYRKLESDLQSVKSKMFTPGLSERELKALKSEEAVIHHQMNNNIVHELIEAGLYLTIVEDFEVSDTTNPLVANAEQLLAPVLDRLPNKVKTATSEILLLQGSNTYTLAREFSQISDFAARYSLHKHNTEVLGMDRSSSIKDVMHTFINYDVPSSKGMQLLNDYAFMGFTKYLFRTQYVIAKRFGQSPARMFALLGLEWLMNINIPDITDSLITGPSEILKRIYSPFDWIAASGEIFSLQLLGSLIKE